MRRPGGYASITDPESPLVERDTYTCGHCNGVVMVKPRQDPSEMGGFCRLCMRHTCNAHKCNAECTPFMKRVEQSEEADYRRRRLLGAVG